MPKTTKAKSPRATGRKAAAVKAKPPSPRATGRKAAAAKLVEIRGISDLRPDPLNVNEGTDRGREFIDWSLTELGAGRSILADAAGTVLAGNKTLEAARAHGLPVRVVKTAGNELVVVQRTDLDLGGGDAARSRARQIALADNRANELGFRLNAEALLTHAAALELQPIYSEAEIEALRAALTPKDGLATGAGETPEENLARFTGDNIKQMVFYVAHSQYSDVVEALDRNMEEMGVGSHSEVLLRLLGFED